jgi:curved DNA-binding protein CbpA
MASDGTNDYYARLEVARGASHGDIVGAYRRLAMGAHPDANPQDPDAAGRFREIAEAYEVLGDPMRRDAYDRQLGGARIPVRVHHAAPADAGGTERRAWRHHEGEPVFLSTSRPRRSDDVSLGASPVRNEHVGARGRGAAPADRWISEVSDLFRRIVESWWEI